ncbi:MAG TPA: beta-propeller domain-containing protein [Allosphingosinicella sp.]|nr:beta-propeller domain-containing protein [Allosphingosinicella sp.]
MDKRVFTWIGAMLGAGALIAGGIALGQPNARPPRPAAAAKASGSLAAFRSDAELRRFLRRSRERPEAMMAMEPPPSPMMAPSPAPPATATPGAADVAAERGVVVTGSAAQQPSITNNQEANVDEGGIVKVSGDNLVILRRGRLFTVSLTGGGMRPVDSINAFPPGVSGEDDWYDEMLLLGDRVIVVGYSYARGGTEINRFRLSPNGRLRYEDSYHLRSNDYYSSRNYASRLIGNRLIFYTPLYLDWDDDPLEALPGMRKWQPGYDEETPFRRIATARQIFIAPRMREPGKYEIETLHSVTNCDLTAPVLDCSAVGVLGPESRTFYVSAGGVYLWVSGAARDEREAGQSFLYRLPFGRELPSAIETRGAPVDQFSFREDAGEGMLNVLVRAESGGDWMGGPEVSNGDVALLRLPIADFGDGSNAAARTRYRRLPNPGGDAWNFQNRFVGDHILYGGGAYGEDRPATLFAAPIRGGRAVTLPLSHAIGRIEILGRDGLVVGSGADGSLGFTAINLAGGARLGDVFTLPAAAEGETRSHAYFFRPDNADGSSGILGLPIAKPVEEAYQRFFGSAASMLFLRRDDRRFAEAGELDAQLRGVVEDDCHASCTDWYGNARPIFLGGRIFALLGYELVEGRLDGGRIRETGRANFSPGGRRRQGD